MKYKVLISDKLSTKVIDILEKRGIEAIYLPEIGKDKAQLVKAVKDCDGWAVRSNTQITSEILKQCKKLKIIGRAGIGVDNIDVTTATQLGVIVTNTPYGNSITTAEHTIALMMAVARSIPQASSSTHAGKWEKSKFSGIELFGKKIGLIGCGNIGRLVATKCMGLGLKVSTFDPYLTNEAAAKIGIEKVELENLFANSDIISLHVPLLDSTKNIINKENIGKIKKGAYIINCARGGLIDEDALRQYIDNGHLAGAATDVFIKEPAIESPLLGSDKIICTPHLGAATKEAQENVSVQVAQQIANFLEDGTINHSLNSPNLTSEEALTIKPHLKLAKQLGLLLGQIADFEINKIEVKYQGESSTLNLEALTLNAIYGVLKPAMSNLAPVASMVTAQNRGIEVSQTTSSKLNNYQNCISIQVSNKDAKHTLSASGSVFPDKSTRIVKINSIVMEATIASNMIMISNIDKVGHIGNLGKLLGDKKINISNFHLGRKKPGGTAISLISIDDELPANLLLDIRALPYVVFARKLIFD